MPGARSGQSMAVFEGTVYAGGSFGAVDGEPHACLAGIAAASLTTQAAEVAAVPPKDRAFSTKVSPNPVRGAARIHFSLPAAASVSLAIFDLQGRRMATLLDGRVQAAREHDAPVRTDGWSPGCYLYRLQVGEQSVTRKFLVVR